MTPEEMNEAIGEHVEEPVCYCGERLSQHTSENHSFVALPYEGQYYYDFGDMAYAESKLNEYQWAVYKAWLFWYIDAMKRHGEWQRQNVYPDDIIAVPPKYRAEAYLRTIGKFVRLDGVVSTTTEVSQLRNVNAVKVPEERLIAI